MYLLFNVIFLHFALCSHFILKWAGPMVHTISSWLTVCIFSEENTKDAKHQIAKMSSLTDSFWNELCVYYSFFNHQYIPLKSPSSHCFFTPSPWASSMWLCRCGCLGRRVNGPRRGRAGLQTNSRSAGIVSSGRHTAGPRRAWLRRT